LEHDPGVTPCFYGIKEAFPKIQFGYFNRTKERFYPEGFEKGWPIN